MHRIRGLDCVRGRRPPDNSGAPVLGQSDREASQAARPTATSCLLLTGRVGRGGAGVVRTSAPPLPSARRGSVPTAWRGPARPRGPLPRLAPTRALLRGRRHQLARAGRGASARVAPRWWAHGVARRPRVPRRRLRPPASETVGRPPSTRTRRIRYSHPGACRVPVNTALPDGNQQERLFPAGPCSPAVHPGIGGDEAPTRSGHR